MIGRTNTGGGGVGGSELVIVGGIARPAKVTQNMIWVNTEHKITSYAISYTEPENPVEGMAWITIGDSGVIKTVSPVGGDWITVYPLTAKQYIDSAWVSVTAMNYQNGEWVEWITYLYNKGDEKTEITGGWGAYYGTDGTYVNKGTLTKNSDNLDISITSTRAVIVVRTNQKIDITPYSTIEFSVKCLSKASSYNLLCGVDDGTNNNPGSSACVVSGYTSADVGELEKVLVDVSELSGSYSVCMRMWKFDETAKMEYQISEVCLR